jgi:hypothetical protein
MATQSSPMPQFHTVLNLPTNDPYYSKVRSVITNRGPLHCQIEYFLSPEMRYKAETPRNACARAIGLFYDFVCAVGHSYVGREDQLLSDFVRKICTGTVFDGEDPTGLWWPKSSWLTTKCIAGYVRRFSDWCIKKYGTKSIASTHTMTWGDRIARYRVLDKINENSLLGHLRGPDLLMQVAGSSDAFDYENEIESVNTVEEYGKAFPRDKFEDLLFIGYKKHGKIDGMPAHLLFKVRDMMASILQGAGGLRECEPFHLWIDDVFEDIHNPGHAIVKVHHPSESVCFDYDSNGKLIKKKRGTYLAELGLVPRNKGRGNYRAGWKNPLLRKVKGTGEIYMPVFFFPTWWGEIFLTLFNIYMEHVRPHGLDHPFLLVNLDKKNYGQPWSIDSYLSSHEKACKNIGLESNLVSGTNPHALRHNYAEELNDALPAEDKIRKKTIQQCLHHKSDKSQEVYKEGSVGKIFEQLSMIQSKMELSHPVAKILLCK